MVHDQDGRGDEQRDEPKPRSEDHADHAGKEKREGQMLRRHRGLSPFVRGSDHGRRLLAQPWQSRQVPCIEHCHFLVKSRVSGIAGLLTSTPHQAIIIVLGRMCKVLRSHLG